MSYYPIVSHGGIPNITNAHGGITAAKIVSDTRVGKRALAHMPHLIANTVDNIARGIEYKPLETEGETSLVKGGKARKLVKSTLTKVARYEELTEAERADRAAHKKVGIRKHAL